MEPQSLTQIISEDDFLPLVQSSSGNFFKTFNAFSSLVDHKSGVTRKCYSNLIQQAELLECFMDEYGARQNRTWLFFAEFVASIRNLVIAAFYVRHLLDRYPYYRLKDTDDMQGNFFKDGQETLDFLNHSIIHLYNQCMKAAEENGLELSNEAVDPGEFSEVEVNKQLPNNAADESIKEDDERIIDLFEKLGNVARFMEEMKIRESHNDEELKAMVPTVLDEKKARFMMNLIHSAQSEFDTYVKNTYIEQKHKDLKNFRGYISMPLHLMEVTIWLCHFYERHEDEIRQGEAKRIISTLVNKKELLGKIVNFCFKYCLIYVREGDRLSKEILKSFIKTVRYELPIPKPLGFHARPSTYISLIVRKYDSDAFLIVGDEKFNGRSVMSLLQAGGTIADKGIQTVVFEGDQRVLDDIKILAENNYCEEKNLPEELSYLRAMRDSA